MSLGLLSVGLAFGCGEDGTSVSGTATDGPTATLSDSLGGSVGPGSTGRVDDGSTGSSSGGSPVDGTASSTGGDSDTSGTETETETGSDTDTEPGTLPRPVAQTGVVYVGHFLSNDLRVYRLDGPTPQAAGTFDLGTFTHDMALDDLNDRLITAHDIVREVRIYDLDRPADADNVAEMPVLRSTITLTTPPRFVKVDPYHARLFVVADDTRSGTGMVRFHMFDIEDVERPTELGDGETRIEATTSIEVDVARGIMFAFHGISDTLGAYDVVTGDTPLALPGSPITMTALYPEDNQFAFQARNLTVDVYNNRLYGARSQGALSELIVLEYPADIPGTGESYGDVATLDDIVVIPDGIDLAIDIADRPGILDAFTPLPSPNDDLVLMLASAWNGAASTATVIGMTGDPIVLAEGCGDHEDFGCFLRSYTGDVAGSHLRTDGAACRDLTNGVVVATAVALPEDEPGSVVMFRYDATDGTMAVALPMGGGNLPASALPVGAVCH